MRIEFEFYPPYSLKSDEELLKLSWARVTGSYDIFLGMTFRPCIKFEVENSYNYFTRYAKTHGISVEQLIDEIVAYHIFIEEKKEIY